MKRLQYAALIFALFVTGCAQPEFKPFVGPPLRTGTGGTVKTIKGMEVWTGSPPRKFTILGTIADVGGKWSTKTSLLERIVPKARARGADALVIMAAERDLSGFDPVEGTPSHRTHVKVAVIKYL